MDGAPKRDRIFPKPCLDRTQAMPAMPRKVPLGWVGERMSVSLSSDHTHHRLLPPPCTPRSLGPHRDASERARASAGQSSTYTCLLPPPRALRGLGLCRDGSNRVRVNVGLTSCRLGAIRGASDCELRAGSM